MKKRESKIKGLVTGLAMVMLLGGCASEGEETEAFVSVEREETEISYDLAVVSEQDILLTESVRCVYEEMLSQEVCFSQNNKLITKVYVELGDSVKKGQLLAELEHGALTDRIEELKYQIQRNQLLLEYAEPNENGELSTVWLDYIYNTNRNYTESVIEARDRSVKQIQQKYRYAREDYQDAIDLDSAELESLQKQLADCNVYAQIDGVVNWIASPLRGTSSVKDEPIMTLGGDSESCFFVDSMEKADLFQDGVSVEMKLKSGGSTNTYRLLPYRIEDWTERMMFIWAEDYEDLTVESGDPGTITVILEERDHVLGIPQRALHEAEGKKFVYVLGENENPEVRWVETGLYGDDAVEILSGLEEGEKVVLQ